MKKSESQICRRCVMDTSDPRISFDENGFCNHCVSAIARFNSELKPPVEREKALAELVEKIKLEGKNKTYDCVIGVSGGVDSTFTAFQVKKLGLRPLAVHFDNGWNSELAVDNIKKTLDNLKIDLYTHVVDWMEFRDIQLSFLNASVANCEAPTDHAIFALLFKTANREKTRFILTGSNMVSEAIMPEYWGYQSQDLRHLKALHRKFGTIPLRTMPLIGIAEYFYYVFVKRIRQIPFLNYFPYNKAEAKNLLAREIGWRDYGGKHYESIWTRFFQGYYLPVKFGFDKRRAHFSTLICSGQMTRQEALSELEKPPYDESLLAQDKEFVLKKFELSLKEFEKIMKTGLKQPTDYGSNYLIFSRLKALRKIFRRIAITP